MQIFQRDEKISAPNLATTFHIVHNMLFLVLTGMLAWIAFMDGRPQLGQTLTTISVVGYVSGYYIYALVRNFNCPAWDSLSDLKRR